MIFIPETKSKGYYLFTVILFILFLLIFDRGLFFLIDSLEGSFYQKKDLQQIFFQKRDFNKQFLQLPKGTYDTLIMGSSRTHRGIHPFYIKKKLKHNAFKIAKAKIRFKFNYYFYKEYKKIAGVPKVVIYGLDYFMFKLKSHPYFMQFFKEEEKEENDIHQGPLLLLSNKEKLDTFLDNALEKFNETFKEQEDEQTTFSVVDPFIGYQATEKLDTTKPPRFKRFRYKGYPGEEGIYFIKLLDELEKDGVQVVLVYLPDFIGTHESNYQYDQFRDDIQSLTAKYGNVTIYDYNRPDHFAIGNAAYFLDGGYGKTNSHLSLTGSRVFHRIFLKDLKIHYRD